jgi:ABC-type bacteriocin/lantibiotic exporter with double-glycine peptidase domain
MFSPLAVFAAYAVQAKLQGKPPLSTAQAFSSLALMQIVGGPSAMLLYSVSTIMSCMGTFQRVEDFLQKGRFEDYRPLVDGKDSLLEGSDNAIEFRDVILDIKRDPQPAPLNFAAIQGSVTMISGPVGCGKSTLLKSVLGELQPKVGRISISTLYIGYCSQTPWLQNATLKKNIIGANTFEEVWYQKILDICNLNEDISQLPGSDDTLLGSRGVTVSGGQKHRIVGFRNQIYSTFAITDEL